MVVPILQCTTVIAGIDNTIQQAITTQQSNNVYSTYIHIAKKEVVIVVPILLKSAVVSGAERGRYQTICVRHVVPDFRPGTRPDDWNNFFPISLFVVHFLSEFSEGTV